MQSIIISGATSMIGLAIIKETLAQNKKVLALVRKNSNQRRSLRSLEENPNLEVMECDISNYRNLRLLMRYDAFIHLAWECTDAASRDDIYTHINGIKYTVDAVHAAHRAGCTVFVDAGSQAEYGPVSEKLSGDTACKPESGYGIAKYTAGKMARLVASQLGMRSCHARIISTFGEGMGNEMLIIYLIKKLLNGERPSLTKCEQLWDYMYVQDTARAFLAIVDNGVDGKDYPIGSGVSKPLREYIEILRDIVNPSVQLGFGEKEYYPHQAMYLCADIEKLQRDTGFVPKVSFEDGIRATAKWVKMQIAEEKFL